jgi:hypothetical protein
MLWKSLHHEIECIPTSCLDIIPLTLSINEGNLIKPVLLLTHLLIGSLIRIGDSVLVPAEATARFPLLPANITKLPAHNYYN